MRRQNHGWGVSLRYRGRTIADRRVRGAVVVGEDPACTFVVPGLGPAVTLASGDTLLGAPGLTGTVVTAAATSQFIGPCALGPGDRAELDLGDGISLELRREDYPRLPFATLFNPRDLARQLVIGAVAVAALAVLVRIEAPVNTLTVRGEPDADEHSLLVRAMFATATEVAAQSVPFHDVYAFDVPPPAPPEPAPMPIVAVAEDVVPVPLAEVDAPVPTTRRKPRPAKQPEVSAIFDVVGGVDGGVLAQLDEINAVDGVPLAFIGSIVPREDPDLLARERMDVPRVEVTAAAIEDVMGPGSAHDEPVPEDIPVVPPLPPVQLDGAAASQTGADSHSRAGAPALRGAPDGLAAIAPQDRCDDPDLTPKQQLDVVFVVDVSTTMTFMLDRIEKQIAQVDAEARAQSLDPRYGLVVFVDDVQIANGGQPYADIAALQADLATWQAFTAGNRQIGSAELNLDWPENTLDAVHAAATQFAWRPVDTTLRMVVHATDDDFREAPAVQSKQQVQHTYRETSAALRAAEIRMFSFAARIGGQCECLDVRAGLFAKFGGQPSLPDATGGAVFDIDAVARGQLGFAAAVSGAIRSGVCTRYPLSPFAPSTEQ